MRAAALLVAALLGPAALAQGTPPGGLDGGTPIQEPFICSACHDRTATNDATLYLPYDGWVSTMMGNAVRDPLFLAALTVANQDHAGSGAFCLRCHSPAAYVRDHLTPPDGSAFDVIDQAGVQCEVCHRSLSQGATIGNAQIVFEPGGIKHGPYANIDSQAHAGVQDPFTSSAELCGQCHQVVNPFNGFALDTTYDEWKGSALGRTGGQTCQGCHMPAYAGSHVVAKYASPRDNPRRHVFVGGNAWGVQAVLAAHPELGDVADAFDETRRQAEQNLKQAASLELSVTPPAKSGGTAHVHVTVRNLTGHKLPTGYADGRRAWVELTVGQNVVSGRYDGDAGTLERDPQLHVYEAVHGRASGPEDHLVLHDTVVRDTRLPPAGFTATELTRPVATTWFDDGDGGFRDRDEIDYDVRVPSGDVRVAARLLYQPTTREYVDFLAQENHTDERGHQLATVYESTGRAAPLEMASAEAQLHVPGCGCGATSGPSGFAGLLVGLALWRSARARAARRAQ